MDSNHTSFRQFREDSRSLIQRLRLAANDIDFASAPISEVSFELDAASNTTEWKGRKSVLKLIEKPLSRKVGSVRGRRGIIPSHRRKKLVMKHASPTRKASKIIDEDILRDEDFDQKLSRFKAQYLEDTGDIGIYDRRNVVADEPRADADKFFYNGQFLYDGLDGIIRLDHSENRQKISGKDEVCEVSIPQGSFRNETRRKIRVEDNNSMSIFNNLHSGYTVLRPRLNKGTASLVGECVQDLRSKRMQALSSKSMT